jgi:hypothetical protein
MSRTPAGRTSSIKASNKVFILQTEFLSKPRPRIITSVALEGQIIHKVERTYDSQIESESEFKNAETAVISQHQNLAKKMQSNGADFVKQTRSIKISAIDRLALIPGITAVADIDEKLSGENPHNIYVQSKLISDIVTSIVSATKMGPLKLAAVVSDQGRFLLTREEEKNYLLSVKPEADIREVINEALKE